MSYWAQAIGRESLISKIPPIARGDVSLLTESKLKERVRRSGGMVDELIPFQEGNIDLNPINIGKWDTKKCGLGCVKFSTKSP